VAPGNATLPAELEETVLESSECLVAPKLVLPLSMLPLLALFGRQLMCAMASVAVIDLKLLASKLRANPMSVYLPRIASGGGGWRIGARSIASSGAGAHLGAQEREREREGAETPREPERQRQRQRAGEGETKRQGEGKPLPLPPDP